MMLHIFFMFMCYLYIFFIEVSVQILSHSFKLLLLNCKCTFYILDRNPLSDMCFANTFFLCVACFFIFSCCLKSGYFNFHEVKFFKLVVDYCVISMKPLPDPRSQRFSLIFSSRNFRVVGFTFGSMIHFTFFEYGAGIN